MRDYIGPSALSVNPKQSIDKLVPVASIGNEADGNGCTVASASTNAHCLIWNARTQHTISSNIVLEPPLRYFTPFRYSPNHSNLILSLFTSWVPT